jgi:hypothetical protein
MLGVELRAFYICSLICHRQELTYTFNVFKTTSLKEENSSIVGGIANLYNHSGNQSGGWFLRKLDIVLPEDPTIPLLGIYPEDVPTSKKDTCSTMFIAALFTILENLIYSVHRSDQNVTSQACRTTEPKRDHMLGRTVLGKGYKQNRMATPMGETKH